MKCSLIKRVSAWVLGASLAISSYAFTGATIVNAASLKLITKQVSNDGYTTTYSYNKNGLISKSVAKYTKTTDAARHGELQLDNVAEDRAITKTTTYKYNKNNKISKKTATTVTVSTYHQMDANNKKNIIADLGTVTTTETTVTEYTYNKKGLCTQSVATYTKGMSGTLSGTGKTSYIFSKGYKELDDGRVIVGYNDYDENGNPVSGNSIANAYFLPNPEELEPVTLNIKIEYKDRGNGAYYHERTETSVDNSYETVTEKKTAGNHEIITSAKATRTEDSTTAVRIYHNEYTNKKVTTTKFTYDSKNRVKKGVTTANTINTTEDTNTLNEPYTEKNEQYTDKGTCYAIQNRFYSDEDTTVSTSIYTYDKNGRVSKASWTNEGVKNSRHTATFTGWNIDEISVTYDDIRTYKDGSPAKKILREGTLSNLHNYYETVTAGGVETSTATYKPYTETLTTNGETTTTQYHYDPQKGEYVEGAGETYTTEPTTKPVIATPSTEISKYTYDKRGSLKTAKASGTTSTVDTVKNPTYGNVIYEVNDKGEVVEKKEAKTNTYSNVKTYDNTVNNNKISEIYNKNQSINNRTQDSSYSLGHRIFNFKSKNAKAEKIAKKQQWCIQNAEHLCGERGLI